MNIRLKFESQKKAQRFIIYAIAFCFLFLSHPLSAQKKSKKKKEKEEQHIVLAEDEVSRYRIVIPAAATEHELKASTVLQDYLLQISGAAVPVVTADKPHSRYEIVLGQNERLDELKIGLNLNTLKEDGF